MSPELGHLSLVMALVMALLLCALPLVPGGTLRLAPARVLICAVNFWLVLAILCLLWGFSSSDFSLALVAAHSSVDQPFLYKLTALWGNHEGSLLLWLLMLAAWSLAFALSKAARARPDFAAAVLSVQGGLFCGLTLFSLLTSNPFMRLSPAPPRGQGLNSLLQDPAMALHPPILYAGTVGLSLAFSFAVAGLALRQVDRTWATMLRPWVAGAWSLLTLGIAGGSWWAYRELGWGGFWFWDPVENISLLPWLLAIALMHSLSVVARREAFRAWALLLALSTLALSLLGAFVVRSGLLSSVHAFANDPARGLFLLLIVAATLGAGFFLYVWRAPSLSAGQPFAVMSRESALLVNNLLLVSAAAAVFLGTFYPLVLEMVTGDRISVGAPYYLRVLAPLLPPLCLLMAIAPILPWRRPGSLLGTGSLLRPGSLVRRRLRALWPSGLCACAAALLALMRGYPWYLLLVDGLCVGLMASCVQHWLQPAFAPRHRRSLGAGLKRLWAQGARRHAMLLAHGSCGLLIMAAATTASLGRDSDALLHPGESQALDEGQLHFLSARKQLGANYESHIALLEWRRPGKTPRRLTSERRIYFADQSQSSETAFASTLSGDLLVTFAGQVPAPLSELKTEGPSAAMGDSSAATEDSSAATEDSSSTTGDSSAATGDSSATTEGPSAATEDSSSTTGDSGAATGDSSAATEDSSAVTEDSSAATEDSSAVTEGPSAATGDSSAATEDSSTATGDLEAPFAFFIHYRPLISFLWIAAILMAFAGLLSCCARRRLRPMQTLALVLMLWLWPGAAWVAGRPAVAAEARGDLQSALSAHQEQRAHRLYKKIRCPTCQNESIASSPAHLAQALRLLIRQELAAGKSDRDIQAGLIRRYGPFITFAPPLQPQTLLLWFAPVLIFAGGAGLLYMHLIPHSQRLRRPKTPKPPPTSRKSS